MYRKSETRGLRKEVREELAPTFRARRVIDATLALTYYHVHVMGIFFRQTTPQAASGIATTVLQSTTYFSRLR